MKKLNENELKIISGGQGSKDPYVNNTPTKVVIGALTGVTVCSPAGPVGAGVCAVIGGFIGAAM
ncbi:hypothetical protein CJJ18_11430 (plasmid) [Candidatus Williamhamiltonella defendens]|uniref:Bacteriocin n=1 Tax=Candidatus Williamhamiltonella defendens TaxID=138072 RepID=A0A4P2SPK6_9ENTR|nr:Blp family class II bacteriocin [Candidatus Hamiltonella defensa]ASV34564.1 hypothetical protein CJJ18_11290 [Candidatus Hamiltonella defensa]ASV34576.1 hypothetical protein CJJ18_11430 [Candidatus Hamiltonella defensa]AWK17524.1 hypothetical protein CCS40_11110 [Candidatus Hamiltonella defensa]AWK17537.1 hypothetical protein CCS40_11250 [Candidatus Hamiltonella defensa]AWK17543.1 hypothetical protein CCS40_11300 [Candidatus Hamiltonella defensa]